MIQNNDFKFDRSLYQAVHVKQPTSVFTFHNFLNSDTEGIDKITVLYQADTLLKKKRINQKEHDRLKEMINSSDKESYELAKMIVAEKQRPLYEKYYHKVKTLIGKAWQ